MMKLLVFIMIVHLPAAFGVDLDGLGTHPDLFHTSKKSFAQTYATDEDWTWTSKDQTTARAFGDMYFLSMPVVEALVMFQKDQVSKVFFSIYNRGDSKPLTEKAFKVLLGSAVKTLTETCKARPVTLRPAWKMTKTRRIWKHGTMVFVLSSSISKRKQGGRSIPVPEYLSLHLYPLEKGKALAAYGGVLKSGRKVPLLDRVVTSDDGDVFIDGVPMIDQGPKGYCACAATARLLQYYGRNVDQHEVAQMARATQDLGTSVHGLVMGLTRIKQRLRINVETIWLMDMSKFKQKMRDYNTVARKLKKPETRLVKGVVDIGGTLLTLDPEIMTQSFAGAKGTKEFMRHLKRNIPKGVPMNWSVMLGLYPEKNLPQDTGGHMRLIIGYNEKRKEVIYTDTWGKGHEFKRMSLAHAVAMTTGLFVIKRQ
jgi:hypothetical protein